MKYLKLFIVSSCLILLLSDDSAIALPPIQDVVTSVSQTTYQNYLDNMLYTHLGDNRGFGPEHDLARDNIYNEFNRLGLLTSYDPFQYGTDTAYNVIGIHQGKTRPNDIYIIGSHYDSLNNPGADDNASGTAGVLEAARVLSTYEFEATIIFAAFDREEQGLLGSKAYVAEHLTDNILGMLSLDMIAYNIDNSNQARVYGRTASAAFKQGVIDAVSLYGNGLVAIDSGSINASDHAPFEDQGFQASLLIEYGVWSNPYYHSVNDSVDTPNYIDYAYATNMVCSTVGFFATNAVLIPEPATLLLFSIGIVIFRKKFIS